MQHLADDLTGCVDSTDLFRSLSELEGEIYREIDNRKTLRFEWKGKGYFVKSHFGVGWGEILKNLVQFRVPVLGASNEWQALRRLKELGVNTMTPVAYVSEGWNPAKIKSCVVTRELENTVSLEDFCSRKMSITLKRKLLEKLAVVSKLLHDNGVNHRDYYICHFLLDIASSKQEVPIVYLIDLHRAQIRSETPLRWRVKDIGALLFSSFHLELTKRDLFRFMKIYSGLPLREILQKEEDFWSAVIERAKRLYLQDKTELPDWISNLQYQRATPGRSNGN
ncbi:MAG: lipopolysaccharide core heptose(I) kinase RfaP [Gammaproteobacteria bacterium]|jgi:heptose I phosphotransferase|nr:lipopolysaccharide core heptose(I) kinase RfaP [Gammaproteobacteria bacterium]|tara:strand:- start:19 stop:858 length:840 start_codon:yes stop_codon:yes gene_type:complete